jgi:hypothetical protein
MRGLFALDGRVSGGTLADLITDAGQAYDLDFDNGKKCILIDFRDSRPVVGAIASDCCRLGTAALQSVSSLEREMVEKDSVAWGIIKIYYAAFYAANAIIRVLGDSCSYFDTSHVSRLKSFSAAIGKSPSFSLDSGLYHCSSSVSATGLSCIRVRGAVGGAHESFWKIFQDRLSLLSEQVLEGPLTIAEAQAVFYQLDSLRHLISDLGTRSHNGLSDVRNALQYKHQFGAWFPVKMRKRQCEGLARLTSHWTMDPMRVVVPRKAEDPISGLVSACVFIISLWRALLLRLAERSSAGTKSFVCTGPMVFLQTTKAKQV